jgi:phosphoribosylformylglycinamidine synthase
VQRPRGDAAVVRVEDGPKALELTTDVTPRYCEADPFEGGKQAVAEAWRNLTAVGARPLALTDNLNFGSPERPEIMGQLVGCIRGIAEACKALDFPVVSGNVSLYNETEGRPILPTPTIGAVGVIADIAKAVGSRLTQAGLGIVLVGDTKGWLGQSLYLREACGREEGAPPPVDLAVERRNGDFVRSQIAMDRVEACHDVSDGGLIVALAEMAKALRASSAAILAANAEDLAPDTTVVTASLGSFAALFTRLQPVRTSANTRNSPAANGKRKFRFDALVLLMDFGFIGQ